MSGLADQRRTSGPNRQRAGIGRRRSHERGAALQRQGSLCPQTGRCDHGQLAPARRVASWTLPAPGRGDPGLPLPGLQWLAPHAQSWEEDFSPMSEPGPKPRQRRCARCQDTGTADRGTVSGMVFTVYCDCPIGLVWSESCVIENQQMELNCSASARDRDAYCGTSRPQPPAPIRWHDPAEIDAVLSDIILPAQGLQTIPIYRP